MGYLRKSIEKPLENKFVKWAREHGIEQFKGPAQLKMGIPDRIIIVPNGGGTLYVEFKGGTSYQRTAMQLYWADLLKSSNPNCYAYIQTKEGLEKLFDYILTFLNKSV